MKLPHTDILPLSASTNAHQTGLLKRELKPLHVGGFYSTRLMEELSAVVGFKKGGGFRPSICLLAGAL